MPIGELSPLQEDDTRYYSTAVMQKTKDRLKLATVAWLKESFESWQARAENQPDLPTIAVPSGDYPPSGHIGVRGGMY